MDWTIGHLDYWTIIWTIFLDHFWTIFLGIILLRGEGRGERGEGRGER